MSAAGPSDVATRPRPVPGGRRARRKAMSHLPAPVSVLTVSHMGNPHGTTVSYTTAVSHEPLLLGACLHGSSSFASLAAAAGRFVVNVLDATQADLARYFADRSRPMGAAQFARVPCGTDEYTGAPVIDGALAVYTCRLLGHTPVGDHRVLLGHVTHVSHNGGDPLLSYDGELFASRLDPVPPAA